MENETAMLNAGNTTRRLASDTLNKTLVSHKLPVATGSTSFPVYLIGISGPPSAGKTTLAHLLSAVFHPHLKQILHGDDFCKDLKLIPKRSGYIDADGPHGVDFTAMKETLYFVKSHGARLPDGYKSWQYDIFPDQKSKALKMVPPQLLDELTSYASRKLGKMSFSIVVIEGLLLYNNPNIRHFLDCRLFIRLDHDEALRRRLSRPLYGAEAKNDEFWKTKDYFEKIVWPNYVEQHLDIMDLDGSVRSQNCDKFEISMQNAINVEIDTSLRWAVGEIVSFLLSRNM